MAYVITGACIRCKYTDCVAVCPVDAFLEGPNMLVIDPDQCIDCGVCEPECPAGAIVPDNMDQPDMEYWIETNRRLSGVYTPINEVKQALPDADSWNPLLNSQVPDKKDMI